eukprot:UN27082
MKLKKYLSGCILVTPKLVKFKDTKDTYDIDNIKDTELVLDKKSIQDAVDAVLKKLPKEAHDYFTDAICIRSNSVGESNQHKDWSDTGPPYFTNEAMTYLSIKCTTHIIVDLPSVDREVSKQVT